MTDRLRVLALLLALFGAMSCVSCRSTDTVTETVSLSEVGPPRIITVLQDPW